MGTTSSKFYDDKIYELVYKQIISKKGVPTSLERNFSQSVSIDELVDANSLLLKIQDVILSGSDEEKRIMYNNFCIRGHHLPDIQYLTLY